MEDQPLSPPPVLLQAQQALAQAAQAQPPVRALLLRRAAACLDGIDMLAPATSAQRLWLRAQVLAGWFELLAQLDDGQARLAEPAPAHAATAAERNRLAWQLDALDTQVLGQMQSFVLQYYLPAPVDLQELQAAAELHGLSPQRCAQLGL